MRTGLGVTATILALALSIITSTAQTGDPATQPSAETAPEAPPDAGTGEAAPAAVPDEVPVASARTGKAYLDQVCSGCHAIGATGDSPDAKAPAFRDILKDYPAESLEESLAEGIVTGHPDMPEVVLDPPQIANVIAYLDALAVVTSP
ncbi:c-type cytochrome [Chthonobacter rhizosphaerae]|uniref:c-type cytochrome n=1 Tax=Chthonobacter rhizosphaerae TaxID=2735553 RepID=UPI0015EE7FC3|nr:cytochrome c [Chthonobacter rhizosphaerae]